MILLAVQLRLYGGLVRISVIFTGESRSSLYAKRMPAVNQSHGP
ncbi:MAG TPA: hypothetical protein VGM64_04100 [Lacunisphaera sp.]